MVEERVRGKATSKDPVGISYTVDRSTGEDKWQKKRHPLRWYVNCIRLK